MVKGHTWCAPSGEMEVGPQAVVMDESNAKPAEARTWRCSGLCSRKGARKPRILCSGTRAVCKEGRGGLPDRAGGRRRQAEHPRQEGNESHSPRARLVQPGAGGDDLAGIGQSHVVVGVRGYLVARHVCHLRQGGSAGWGALRRGLGAGRAAGTHRGGRRAQDASMQPPSRLAWTYSGWVNSIEMYLQAWCLGGGKRG